jgi:transcription initiation factor TFIID TATA-box-binding protein
MTSIIDLDTSVLSEKNIDIKNFVAKLELGIELDLDYLNSQIEGATYEPERYPSLIYRSNNKPTVLITRTGILLFTGGSSPEDIMASYGQISEELSQLGVDSIGDVKDIIVKNIVTVFEYPGPLDLSQLSIKLGIENIEYEPEQFPGMVYRMGNGVVALIFASGKIILTGGNSSSQILSAAGRLYEII